MTQPTKDYWEFFSDEAARGHSPLYAKLALGIGRDPFLSKLAQRKSPNQPPANILLAAVHYLLLSGVDHPLADHYLSVRPSATPQGDPVPLFADFVRTHEAALIPLVERGVTNTNEAARSTSLYPAFDYVARQTGHGLHLLELGPSAGFNLNFDRYSYDFVREGVSVLTRGDGSLRLTADLRGSGTPVLSAAMPKILSRRGLELNPVDLNDAHQRLWLKALVWPELAARHVRLDKAIEVQRMFPAPIFHGDALQLLTPAIETLDPEGVAVVYHSHVTYQFTSAMRQMLEDKLSMLSHRRPIHRVSIEYSEGAYPIRHDLYTGGAAVHTILGHCDPHGMWLEWSIT